MQLCVIVDTEHTNYSMDKIIGIYKLENLMTNEWYVGKSINVQRRWRQHFDKCFLKSDGWTAKVLEECEFEVLNEREKFHVANEKLNGGVCKNKTTGGGNGAKVTDEVRATIKAGLARPEVKVKCRAASKSTMNNPETKAKHKASIARANARPEVREKRNAAIAAANKKPETRVNRSIAQNRPETQAKRRASLLVIMNSPEVKAKLNSPEAKAKYSASLKAAHARRREEKERLLAIEKENKQTRVKRECV